MAKDSSDYDHEGKKKLSRTPDHLSQLRTALDNVGKKLDKIRLDMIDGQLPSALLATKTFKFKTAELDGLAEKYAGQVREQIAQHASRLERAKEKADMIKKRNK